MTAHSNNSKNTSFDVGDILYVIFRHKWKIILFTLLGMGAAGGYYYFKPPPYVSQAKLLIRYVTDSKGPDASRDDIVRQPDLRGNSIINSEVEILQSQDSILRAVQRVGAKKILAKNGGGTNEITAGRLIAENLMVDVGRNSGVIVVTFKHKDGELAQRVLQQIVDEYLEKHIEVHRAVGTFDFLQEQTDQIRLRLTTMEEELRREKNKAGIIDLKQSKEDISAHLLNLRKMIGQAEAELAEREARLNQLLPTAEEQENLASATNPTGPLSPADINKYKQLAEKLAALKAKEGELLAQFKETSRPVQQLRQQITETEKSLTDLGIDPQFAMAEASKRNMAAAAASAVVNLQEEKAKVSALQAKIRALSSQLEKWQEEANKIDLVENSILALQRKRDLTEEMYNYFSKNLEQARIDQAVDSGKLNNISVVQKATVADQRIAELVKMLAIIIGSGVAAGLGLAFAIDFFLAPKLNRPKHVESVLQVPVFASVPNFGVNGHSKLKQVPAKNGESNVPTVLDNGDIPPWEEGDPMLPYYEAIRDRLVMSYHGDLHKPKIVGLTSCAPKSGVTRIAMGLAASLSRDVERNVLLIELRKNQVMVSSYAKGRPSSGVADAAPEDAAPDRALVQQTLESLCTTGRNRTGASIVQTFSDLLPRLKASEYDYIIFDLPPLTQTSGSLRLASQMERTLLVLEGENTAREKAVRAKTLLSQTGTRVAVVLNKARHYGPKSLLEEV